MNVIAARCEHCKGLRIVKVAVSDSWAEWIDCPVCDPDGMERPPHPDHDRNARRAIEGTRDDE